MNSPLAVGVKEDMDITPSFNEIVDGALKSPTLFEALEFAAKAELKRITDNIRNQYKDKQVTVDVSYEPEFRALFSTISNLWKEREELIKSILALLRPPVVVLGGVTVELQKKTIEELRKDYQMWADRYPSVAKDIEENRAYLARMGVSPSPYPS